MAPKLADSRAGDFENLPSPQHRNISRSSLDNSNRFDVKNVFAKTLPLRFFFDQDRKEILNRFSAKYGVRLYSSANVGNHLHLHLQLTNRYTYPKFIRAVTAAIAVAIVGNNRWTKLQIKFWDLRPFTRVLDGFKAFLTLRDYIRINQLEGGGQIRVMARLIVGSEVTVASG